MGPLILVRGKNGTAINILAGRDYENFSDITNSEAVKISPEKLPYPKHIKTKLLNSKNILL